MTNLNRFQFEPVKQQRQDPNDMLQLHEAEDPRNDPFYVHPGYEKRIPLDNSSDPYYMHTRTQRRMDYDTYKRETRMYDRVLDQHYYPDEEED